MPFWLHDNRLVYASRHLSTLVRVAITFVSLTIIFFCWLFFIYLPSKEVMFGCVHVQQQYEHEMNAYKKSLQNADHVVMQGEHVQKNYDELRASKHALHEGVDALLSLLKKSNLTSDLFEPMRHKQIEQATKMYVTLKAHGTFKRVIAFLHELKSSPHFFKIKMLELVRSKNHSVTMCAHIRVAAFTEKVHA